MAQMEEELDYAYNRMNKLGFELKMKEQQLFEARYWEIEGYSQQQSGQVETPTQECSSDNQVEHRNPNIQVNELRAVLEKKIEQ